MTRRRRRSSHADTVAVARSSHLICCICVFARRCDKWADLFLRTALSMREAPPETQPCWRELTLVAKALADGRDLTEIGLMRDIAERTIVVLASERHMGR
jgi:hypothetical protein